MKRSDQFFRTQEWSSWQCELPHYQEIEKLRIKTARQMLDKASVDKWAGAVEAVEPLKECPVDFNGPAVDFGGSLLLPPAEEERLRDALKALMPWRKGPFRFFGIDVDAEWRSDWKWQRLAESARLDLRGKRIVDIGCNNLYYMLRMLPEDPELVYGVDPMARYWGCYELFRRLAPDERLRFDLFGVEEMPLFERFFDTAFLMGILYHRRDPLGTLQAARACLKKGGQLILETAGIPGDGPYCLFPESRYMKAPGYWFLPTVSAVEAMLTRSGFTDVETFSVEPLTTREQRSTNWAVFESLEDFLDQKDPSKTVEGYPAPIRFAVSCRVK